MTSINSEGNNNKLKVALPINNEVTDSTQQSLLPQLPDEVLIPIFSELNTVEHTNLSLSCKDLHRVAEDPFAWRSKAVALGWTKENPRGLDEKTWVKELTLEIDRLGKSIGKSGFLTYKRVKDLADLGIIAPLFPRHFSAKQIKECRPKTRENYTFKYLRGQLVYHLTNPENALHLAAMGGPNGYQTLCRLPDMIAPLYFKSLDPHEKDLYKKHRAVEDIISDLKILMALGHTSNAVSRSLGCATKLGVQAAFPAFLALVKEGLLEHKSGWHLLSPLAFGHRPPQIGQFINSLEKSGVNLDEQMLPVWCSLEWGTKGCTPHDVPYEQIPLEGLVDISISYFRWGLRDYLGPENFPNLNLNEIFDSIKPSKVIHDAKELKTNHRNLNGESHLKYLDTIWESILENYCQAILNEVIPAAFPADSESAKDLQVRLAQWKSHKLDLWKNQSIDRDENERCQILMEFVETVFWKAIEEIRSENSNNSNN